MTWYDDAARMTEAVQQYGSPTQAAKALGGISERAARERWRVISAASSGITPGAPAREAEPAEILALQKSLDRSEQARKALAKQTKAHVSKSNMLDDVRDMLAPIMDEYPKVARQAAKVRDTRKPRRGRQVEMVMHASDWHVGEVIDPVQVQGRNEYGPQVAAKRVEHFANVASEWIENYENLHGVSRITLTVLGDMASGMHVIHPEEAVEYARIVVQCLDASLLLAQLIRRILQHGIPVRVITTRGGNHPRSTRRMPSGEVAAQTSWEHFMYEHLAAMLQSEEIEWSIGRAYTNSFDVAGQRFTVMHGDAIKGGGGALGIPAYGAKRQTNAQIMASLAAAIDAGDFGLVSQHIRCGHFHEDLAMRTPTGTFRIVPALKGTGAWELECLGKISAPEQLIEVVHPDHGIIGSHIIDCSVTRGLGYVWGAMKSDQPAHALIA